MDNYEQQWQAMETIESVVLQWRGERGSIFEKWTFTSMDEDEHASEVNSSNPEANLPCKPLGLGADSAAKGPAAPATQPVQSF